MTNILAVPQEALRAELLRNLHQSTPRDFSNYVTSRM